MPTLADDRRLIMFGRYPVPGRTKTRLIPASGPLGAADLHRRLAERTLSVLTAACPGTVDVAYSGGTPAQVKRWLSRWPVRQYAQPHGDLGRRMGQVIRWACDQGARRVVLVGTDVPGLTTRHVTDAFQALEGHDLVLGPSRDGGYWLIGCRRPAPVFDGIHWGTSEVLIQTRQAAEAAGMSVACLETLQDIDTASDLTRWRPDGQWRRPYLSIVIPALNEAGHIGANIAGLGARDVEIIVVDGGSRDGTPQAARRAGARVIDAPRGRARQQNAGARHAAGRVLLFLHADTVLPRDFGAQIFERLMDPAVVLGAFRFRTDYDHRAMRWIERAVHARCRLLSLPYGDQALFMRRSDFARAGGFPDVPLAEDLFLVRRMARRGRIELTPGAAVTSGRRWREVGIVRLTLVHTLIAAGCLAGIDPGRLTAWHRFGASTIVRQAYPR